jgi:hypothetical protein
MVTFRAEGTMHAVPKYAAFHTKRRVKSTFDLDSVNHVFALGISRHRLSPQAEVEGP